MGTDPIKSSKMVQWFTGTSPADYETGILCSVLKTTSSGSLQRFSTVGKLLQNVVDSIMQQCITKMFPKTLPAYWLRNGYISHSSISILFPCISLLRKPCQATEKYWDVAETPRNVARIPCWFDSPAGSTHLLYVPRIYATEWT
jgi:hypothetical protein